VVSESVSTPTQLDAAPPRLVEDGQQRFGRFGTAVERANLIDARYRGLPRPLRALRLKEWQALQVTGPGVFANLALFDAKLMSLLQAKVYDRARGEKIVHEWKLRPRAFRVADQLLDSTTSYRDRRGALSFRNQMTRGRLTVELELAADPGRGLPRVAGRLEVHTDRGASQVVSLPFARAGGMYSHKGMFPIEGTLEVGERTFRFRPGDSLALLDDHKGYYPYVMRWDWVTSATFDAGGRALGFNLTRNQCREPDTFNENCAWRGDRLGVLPAVTFTREHERGPGEQWRIRDRDGRVDVTFTPTVPGDVRVNALVVESRYRGPFGTFRGRLEPDGLEPLVIDDWFGMGEDFYLRC
jgi:hypothetical protein